MFSMNIHGEIQTTNPDNFSAQFYPLTYKALLSVTEA